MARDQMTQEERSLLEDPFLEVTTDVGISRRSPEFVAAYNKKFGTTYGQDTRSSFDVALDNRINQDPSAIFAGQMNAMLRDPSVRAELVERDPRFRQKWKENLKEDEAKRFAEKLRPDYYPSTWNWEVLMSEMAKRFLGPRGAGLDSEDACERLWEADHFTAENIAVVYDELLALGNIQVAPGKIKPLTDYQLLEITALAQSEGPVSAILKYLSDSLGADEMPNANDSQAIARFRASRPQLFNEACLYVFRALNGIFDSEFEEFKQMMLTRMPLLTYQALVDGYAEFRRATKSSALFPNGRVAAAQETTNPDDMSDEELAAAILAQRRAARSARTR